MQKRWVAPLLITLFSTSVYAFDTSLLNDSLEGPSRRLSRSELDSARKWGMKRGVTLEQLKSYLKSVMSKQENREAQCDIGLSNLLIDEAFRLKLVDRPNEVSQLLNLLRSESLIDDIFLKLNHESLKLALKFRDINQAPSKHQVNPVLNPSNKFTKDKNLEELYSFFKPFPAELDKCSINTYRGLVIDAKAMGKKRDRRMKKLDYLAYKKEVIDLPTYLKLDTLRSNDALDWPVYLARYMDNVSNVKNKLLKPDVAEQGAAKFTTRYVNRREKLTRRESLYSRYDSTQIMMMAQVIEKQAKRMDAYQASVTFQFDEQGQEVETYVLSPMEQYRASIKFLKKDYAELMRSAFFAGSEVSYEDLIASSIETGLIGAEELEYILGFEEFWNPKNPKWKTYANFAFSLLGTATFYLPPPWNVVGAIGLIFTQTKLYQKQKKADSDNNWNTIF